jgi:5-methylcytosine-specific restriction endonuclease McrA
VTARDHKTIRAALEDQGECRLCGTPNNLDPHHIISRSLRQNDSPENIMALCRRCHDLVHKIDLWPFLTEGEKRHAEGLVGKYRARLLMRPVLERRVA